MNVLYAAFHLGFDIFLSTSYSAFEEKANPSTVMKKYTIIEICLVIGIMVVTLSAVIVKIVFAILKLIKSRKNSKIKNLNLSNNKTTEIDVIKPNKTAVKIGNGEKVHMIRSLQNRTQKN